MKTPVAERLRRRSRQLPNGCIVFTGHVRKSGYATILHEGRKQLVHRVAYELAYGAIPEGLVVDHVWARGCTSRACVNPAHLEAVTPHENNRRSNSRSALEARQTHCIHNHPFDEENTRIDKRGRRHCRACDRARVAKYRAAHPGRSLAANRAWYHRNRDAQLVDMRRRYRERCAKAAA